MKLPLAVEAQGARGRDRERNVVHERCGQAEPPSSFGLAQKLVTLLDGLGPKKRSIRRA